MRVTIVTIISKRTGECRRKLKVKARGKGKLKGKEKEKGKGRRKEGMLQ